MQLFRFAHPDFLYLLLLLPAVVLLFILNELRKRKALKRLGDANLVSGLVPELSGIRPVIKFILQLVAVTSGIIMLSRPQFGSKIEDVKKQGVELRRKDVVLVRTGRRA